MALAIFGYGSTAHAASTVATAPNVECTCTVSIQVPGNSPPCTARSLKTQYSANTTVAAMYSDVLALDVQCTGQLEWESGSEPTISNSTAITDDATCGAVSEVQPALAESNVWGFDKSVTTTMSCVTGDPAAAAAAAIPELPPVPLSNPLGNRTSIPVIVGDAIKVALGILGAITLFVFVDGAWNWITSAGYPQRVQKGIRTMLFAVAGLFVIFAAYGILNAFISALTIGNLPGT